MSQPEKKDFAAMVLYLQDILPNHPVEMMVRLLAELDMMIEDYDRYITIEYLAGNYSSNNHLANSILRGLDDSQIMEAMVRMRGEIKDEIKSRRKK